VDESTIFFDETFFKWGFIHGFGATGFGAISDL
jgi:hypothetical protein